MTINLIGKEKSNDEDLLETAIKNQTIRHILDGKAVGSANSYGKNILVHKAKESVVGAGYYFGHNDSGFIYETKSNHSVNVYDNALLAIDKFLLGEVDEAKDLVQKIELDYWFDKTKGIFKNTINNSGIAFIDATAAVAIAKTLFGDKDKARELIDNIIKNTSKYKGLLARDSKCNKIYTIDNAMLAIACSLYIEQFNTGRGLIDNIEKEIKFDEKTGLIKEGIGSEALSSDSNSIFAVAEYMIRNKEKAYDLVRKIEENVSISVTGVVYQKEIKHRYDESTRACFSLSLAFAYLTLGGAMDKYMKKRH
jgi:hypothetical protein